MTIVENANLANSKDQDLTFKEQVIKPDQRRYETRIQWLIEDAFGRDIPVLFHFDEMALDDLEVIARTRSYYQPAMLVNEVREANGFPAAGVDPETGETSDPVLEEWGKRPFEVTRGTNLGAFPGDTGATGMSVPLNDLAAAMASQAGKVPAPAPATPVGKAWSEFRQLQEMAKDLGFVIEQAEEVFEGQRTIYKSDGLHELAEAIANQPSPNVIIEKGALQLVAPATPAPEAKPKKRRTVTQKDFLLNERGQITGVKETSEEE